MSRIERLRREANLTQKELAELIEVDTSTICRWELGETMPRQKALKKLAALFNCRMGDLLEEEAS